MKEKNNADYGEKTVEPKTNTGTGRIKITVRRNFGDRDMMDLYTDYIAEKILTDKRTAERGIA